MSARSAFLGIRQLSDALEVRAAPFVVGGQNYFRAQGTGRLQCAFAVRGGSGRAVPAPWPGGDSDRAVYRCPLAEPLAGRQPEVPHRGDGESGPYVDLINFLLSIDSTTRRAGRSALAGAAAASAPAAHFLLRLLIGRAIDYRRLKIDLRPNLQDLLGRNA